MPPAINVSATSMPTKRHQFHAIKLFFITLLALSPLLANANAFERLFAPKPELWNVWLAYNDSSQETINHQSWDEFLQTNVQHGADGINRIAYPSLSETDLNRLRAYIESMQAIKISDYNRNQQLAYWINLYNAVTVNIVLSQYPVESIRDIDISPGFLSDGPWGKKMLNINDNDLSLNDIEHRILRPIWKDARIHYAVNCASVGCPNLRNHAYSATSIDVQLDSAAREYIAHPRGVTLTDKGIHVSSIYSWFQRDFGGSKAGVIEHIQNYANTDTAKALDATQTIAGYHYDWSLNDASVLQP